MHIFVDQNLLKRILSLSSGNQKMSKREQPSILTSRHRAEEGWSEQELNAIEANHPDGMTVATIVTLVTDHGGRLTEATFRKYVQLGLLPRSKRVGRKGRGSQGLYPATAVRQFVHIRRLMSQGFSIEEIQKEFLFVRGDIEALSRQLDRVVVAIETAANERTRQGEDLAVSGALEGVRELGAKLVARLETIERGLTMRARMARAAV